MIKRLQDISFRVSRYFRPLETWHCGGMEDGKQCLMGPDSKGNCRAISDCAPEQKDHTWVCARSELFGGACRAGPDPRGGCGRQRPPCKPVRSVRSSRARFAWLSVAVVSAVVGLVVTINNWQQPINPGALSKHHATFGEQQCQACHSAIDSPRASWLERAIGTGSFEHAETGDSQRCSSCHKLGTDSQGVHSLSAEKLTELIDAAQLRIQAREVPIKTSLFMKAAKTLRGTQIENAPACSVCHEEHKGVETNISSVTNQQCAICHSDSFDDFSQHAEFNSYPAAERTQIIFNHNSHFNKHFSEDDVRQFAPETCVDCHSSDEVGRKMEIKSFESNCSSCHLDQITGESRAGDKGFAMLSIPGIDLDTLKARGIDIGEWPRYSDAEFTPLNYLLVAANSPHAAEQLAHFKQLDLFDLRSASDSELRSVYDIAWSLKQVYFKLQRSGARDLSRGLARIIPGESASAGRVLGLLSPAVIDQAIADAFPNLATEMVQWLEQGQPEFKLLDTQPSVVTGGNGTETAAQDEDEDWLSSVVEESDDDLSDDDWFADALGDDDALFDDDEPAAEENKKDESKNDETGDDEWLNEAVASDDDEDDWFADALNEEESDDDWFDEDSADDLASAVKEKEIRAIPADENAATKPVSVDVAQQLSLEERAAAGGWYYDNNYLHYRPTGHADRLIVEWIDRLTNYKPLEKDTAQFATRMRQTLVGENTPGSCLKCHSADYTDDHKTLTKVHWSGQKTAPSIHDFNAFTHRSHLSVAGSTVNNSEEQQTAGCSACHKLNLESDSSVAYETDGHTFQSDFHDLTTSQCETCHNSEPALAACTECHNYHIGERGLVGIENSNERMLGSIVQKDK